MSFIKTNRVVFDLSLYLSSLAISRNLFNVGSVKEQNLSNKPKGLLKKTKEQEGSPINAQGIGGHIHIIPSAEHSNDATATFTLSPAPWALLCCVNFPGDRALYDISFRQLIALHSGFIQTSPRSFSLAFGYYFLSVFKH